MTIRMYLVKKKSDQKKGYTRDWIGKRLKKRKKIEGHIPCHVNVLEMDLAFSTCTW
jgi:hypothetical protein